LRSPLNGINVIPMAEKYGGLWVDDSADGTQVAYERHDERLDLLAVVFRQLSGTYRACLFEKTRDPQWSLPCWSERPPDSLFLTEAEAVAHLALLMSQVGVTA
jgi:hypothetical protein